MISSSGVAPLKTDMKSAGIFLVLVDVTCLLLLFVNVLHEWFE